MAHRPRKRFSQNFLIDEDVVRRMVAVIRPQPGQFLVEIGPGLGVLTRPLLQRAESLDVVEIDSDLVVRLAERLQPSRGLRIHHADALRFDYAALWAAQAAPRLRVVGNIPYHITSPLLFHLLSQCHAIQDMHLMLQQEVAERIVSLPGQRTYGRLSVMIQYRCRADKLFVVHPRSFRPAPRVTSAVVRLVTRSQPAVAVTDPLGFEQLVARAFSQRRKTIRNCLKGMLDADGIRAAGVDAGARPETLDLAQFAALAEQVRGRP